MARGCVDVYQPAPVSRKKKESREEMYQKFRDSSLHEHIVVFMSVYLRVYILSLSYCSVFGMVPARYIFMRSHVVYDNSLKSQSTLCYYYGNANDTYVLE
jgi:hypothetical protein